MWPTAVQARARYYGLCIIPSSNFRAPDSVPRVPDIGSAPPDFRNFRTTSGCPLLVHQVSQLPSGVCPAPPASILRPPCPWSGPVSCPYSRTRTGVPSSETSGTSGRCPVLSSQFLESTDLSPGYFPVFHLLCWNLPLGHMSCHVWNCIVT
ncbi:hypothetical protein K438DRAFT_1796295 [Mycena galopus ATCC 62051]|nr:hypothetical protein K438DRAFT_1796295 [Mycena galopus ATCC 62051]